MNSARKMGKWTENEDSLLKELVLRIGKNWSKIADSFPNRTAAQISSRWEKCLDPNLHKGPFTPEEDEKIIQYVKENGPKDWRPLSELLGVRSPKQCRERWVNSLNPNLSKEPWTAEEDRVIFDAHSSHGGKWALIARLLPGRSDNAIKNRWNSSISKRIQREPNGMLRLLPEKIKKNEVTMTQLPPPPANLISNQIQRSNQNIPRQPIQNFQSQSIPNFQSQTIPTLPTQTISTHQNQSISTQPTQTIPTLPPRKTKILPPIQIPPPRQNHSIEINLPERHPILSSVPIIYPGVELNLFSPGSPFPGADLFSPTNGSLYHELQSPGNSASASGIPLFKRSTDRNVYE